MAKNLDRVVVVDVEATCWEGEPPPGQRSEIIEIGVCFLHMDDGRVSARRSILVRPRHSTVSDFCTELTTLTPQQVAGGVDFAEACSLMQRDYDSRSRAWASYGDYDRRQFWRQCRDFAVPYPFGPTHINVKNLFSLAMGLEREVDLLQALGMCGLALEGTYHRGGDDAWNIARLLSQILPGKVGG